VIFKSPSEHTFDGVHAALEMQIYHEDYDSGRKAILAILYDVGDESDFMTQYQKVEDGSTTLDLADFYQNHLEPSTNEDNGYGFLTYSGSLTHPPCTEGVSWTVLKEIYSLSEEQLEWFTDKIGKNDLTMYGNNRVIQDAGDHVLMANNDSSLHVA
jgi:carbonic anhydrase